RGRWVCKIWMTRGTDFMACHNWREPTYGTHSTVSFASSALVCGVGAVTQTFEVLSARSAATSDNWSQCPPGEATRRTGPFTPHAPIGPVPQGRAHSNA